jgi:hypothetical protein
MKRALGFISLIVVMGVVWVLYSRQVISLPGGSNPRATIDVTGVRADLLNIAHAERAHQSREGHYVSLDDLRSAGDLTLPANGRYGYTYSVTFDDNTFRVNADRIGPPDAGAPTQISVDDAMNVTQQ